MIYSQRRHRAGSGSVSLIATSAGALPLLSWPILEPVPYILTSATPTKFAGLSNKTTELCLGGSACACGIDMQPGPQKCMSFFKALFFLALSRHRILIFDQIIGAAEAKSCG